jgi:hypothetical protein
MFVGLRTRVKPRDVPTTEESLALLIVGVGDGAKIGEIRLICYRRLLRVCWIKDTCETS